MGPGNGAPLDPEEPSTDLPVDPDSSEPPGDEGEPPMVDPNPGFGSDAGLGPEAGATDGGVLDAD
jgi:hypothetical protein